MMLTGRRGRRKSSAFLDVARGRTRMFGNGGNVGRQRDRRGSNISSNALYKAARRASRFGGGGGGGGGRRRRRRGYDQVSDDDCSDGELTDHFDEDEDEDEDGFEFDESSEDDEERGRGRGRGRGRFARPRPPPAPESDASGSSKKATKSWWKKVTRGTGTNGARGGTKGGAAGVWRGGRACRTIQPTKTLGPSRRSSSRLGGERGAACVYEALTTMKVHADTMLSIVLFLLSVSAFSSFTRRRLWPPSYVPPPLGASPCPPRSRASPPPCTARRRPCPWSCCACAAPSSRGTTSSASRGHPRRLCEQNTPSV